MYLIIIIVVLWVIDHSLYSLFEQNRRMYYPKLLGHTKYYIIDNSEYIICKPVSDL